MNFNLDNAISIVIVVFILSMISERLATLLKLYISDRNFLWWSKLPIGNLRNRESEPTAEKDREARILVLNMFCGIFLALAINADLIYLFQHMEKPGMCVGYAKFAPVAEEDCCLFLLLNVLGCLVMGFLISLGSKFWHDLLDFLFEVKNLRRKLNDEKTYQVASTNELIEHLKVTDSMMVDKAIKEHKALWMSVKGVLNVGKGSKLINGERTPVVQIGVVSSEVKATLPDKVFVEMENQRQYPVAITVINHGGEVIAHAVESGSELHNQSSTNKTGTLAAVVKNLDSTPSYFILSCYHVLRYNQPWGNFAGAGGPVEIRSNEDQNFTAELVYGQRTTAMDAALAKLDSAKGEQLYNRQKTSIKGSREIILDDLFEQTDFTLLGNISSKQKCKLHGTGQQISIKYSETDRFQFENLLAFCKPYTNPEDTEACSKPGDSGGLIIDKNGMAVAMLVGGSNTVSYAIPFTTITNNVNIQI